MTVNLSITKCTGQELTRSKMVPLSKESSMKIGRSIMDLKKQVTPFIKSGGQIFQEILAMLPNYQQYYPNP